MKVSGYSMLPTLYPDDILLLKNSSSLHAGDIAVLKINEDLFVVKRVRKIIGTALEVVGDNRFCESSVALSSLRVEPVIGKVLASCSLSRRPKISFYL